MEYNATFLTCSRKRNFLCKHQTCTFRSFDNTQQRWARASELTNFSIILHYLSLYGWIVCSLSMFGGFFSFFFWCRCESWVSPKTQTFCLDKPTMCRQWREHIKWEWKFMSKIFDWTCETLRPAVAAEWIFDFHVFCFSPDFAVNLQTSSSVVVLRRES